MISTIKRSLPVMAVIISVSVCAADEQAEKIQQAFNYIERTFATYVSSTNFSSLSLDSVSRLFTSLISSNGSVNLLMRINSSGIVINEVSADRVDTPMRSVENQSWFSDMKKELRPYYGLTRESNAKTFLFWAWPAAGPDGQLLAVLATKLDPAKISIDAGLSTIPVKIEYKGKTVFSNLWNSDLPFKRRTLIFPDSSNFIFYYAAEQEEQKEITPGVENDPEPESEKVSRSSEIKKGSAVEKKKSGFLILSVFLFISAGVFLILFMRKKKKPECFEEDSTDSKCEETSTECISCTSEEKEDGEPINLQLEKEETESAPEPVQNRNTEDNTISLRGELYREIHSQILHWVICESARLSGRLDELTERIDRIEKDNEPGIEGIKMEAQQISREIEIFKTHLSSSTDNCS